LPRIEATENAPERTLIANLRPKSQVELVRFKVLEMESQKEVVVKRTGMMHRVAELQVADESARILLTVWDNDDSCDMSRPFAGKKPKKKRERSDTGRTFRGTQKRESRGYCSWKSF
jgi:hypothetical protein